MTTVLFAPNALEPGRVETHEVPALIPWLRSRFKRWPKTARVYHRFAGRDWDVTPQTAEDVDALEELDGTFLVRLFPAGLDPVTVTYGVIRGAMSVWDAYHQKAPNIKLPEQRARERGGSPNNSLGKRENSARPQQRIPYILGTIPDAVPDLLTVPYSIFEDHVEVEIAYYCVGVGDHTVLRMRDGDSPISQIEGASVEVYGPGKAPTGGLALHEPHTTIGEPIEDDVYNVYQVEAVNGQELRGWSDGTFYGSAFPQNQDTPLLISWFDNGDGTGIISVPYTSDATEITDRVQVGDELFVYWPAEFVPPGGIGTVPDLSTPISSFLPFECEPLTVTAIDDTDTDIQYVYLTVDIPTGQQSEWALLQTYFEDLQDPGDLFPYEGAAFPHSTVTVMRDMFVGPFFIDFAHPAGSADFEIVCNFVAPRGLYSDDGVTTRAMTASIIVTLTPVDAVGTPVGDPEEFQGFLEGSATARGQRAVTMRCKPTGFDGITRCLVQARRITNSPRRQRQIDEVEEDVYSADLDAEPPIVMYFSGTVVDEIRWTHCYSMSKPPNISFGDVTTIHARTVATSGAVRVKTRQLRCTAARKVQTWDGDSFGGALVSSDAVENLLFTIMKDIYVGNLPDSLIDFEGIVAAADAVRASVFSPGNEATRFAYTFDDPDLSFEETLQAICQACFLVPYRSGGVFKVRPEIAGDDSVLLLNHRNILPGTQQFTHTFGSPTENDSVEVGFKDATTDETKVTVGPSTLRTKQLGVIGIRSKLHAYWHAYRAFHKMRYQRQSVTLEATQEAAIVGARERVLIADGTRSSTQAGEVLAFDDSIVTTSQPVALQPGRAYTLHLQQPDGTVSSHTVVASPGGREIEIEGSPDVITDPDEGVRTGYFLVPDDEPTPRAYLVSSVVATTPMTHQVEAVNYSHMYYLADGLGMWVDFGEGMNDKSPIQRLLDNNGGAIVSGEWVGESGDYFEAVDAATTDGITASYTKLLWITATAPGGTSKLIASGDNDTERFQISTFDVLEAGHDGEQVSVDYTDFLGSEHMVALTYDEPTERMALFIDGALVDEATVDTDRSPAITRYLEDFQGTCRLAMKWGRALSDRAIMEVFLRTRTV